MTQSPCDGRFAGASLPWLNWAYPPLTPRRTCSLDATPIQYRTLVMARFFAPHSRSYLLVLRRRMESVNNLPANISCCRRPLEVQFQHAGDVGELRSQILIVWILKNGQARDRRKDLLE